MKDQRTASSPCICGAEKVVLPNSGGKVYVCSSTSCFLSRVVFNVIYSVWIKSE